MPKWIVAASSIATLVVLACAPSPKPEPATGSPAASVGGSPSACPSMSPVPPRGLALLELSIRGTLDSSELSAGAVDCSEQADSVDCLCREPRCQANLQRLCLGFQKAMFRTEGGVASCHFSAPLEALPALFVGENPPTCQAPGTCGPQNGFQCPENLCCYVYQFQYYCCRIPPYD